jgi:hypothetical protein
MIKRVVMVVVMMVKGMHTLHQVGIMSNEGQKGILGYNPEARVILLQFESSREGVSGPA